MAATTATWTRPAASAVPHVTRYALRTPLRPSQQHRIQIRPVVGITARRNTRGGSLASSASSSSRRLLVSAIGFDLPGSPGVKGVEKQAEELVTSAASLLLYQPVLKGRPAQAFLKVLLRLQGGSPAQLLEAYGEFYQELSSKGYSSWQEYLLRQVLWGKFCLFAQQAAAGQLPPGHTSPIHKAAAHDLDVLQKLCLAEATLAAWVRDSAPGISDDWLTAASSLAGGEGREEGGARNGVAPRSAPPSGLCGPPATPAELRAAADELASHWRWGEGLPELQSYYETFGAGLLGHHWHLAWDSDHLAELAPAEVPSSGWSGRGEAALRAALPGRLTASLDESESDALEANTAAHASSVGRSTAQHCLVRGPAGTATSALLWAPLSAAAREGLRVVKLPASSRQVTHASLEQLCRGLAKHRRMRFVVVLENLQVRMGNEDHTSLVTHLSGMGGTLWPENVLLYATTPITGPLLPGSTDGGVLEGCFGLVLVAGKYDERGMSI